MKLISLQSRGNKVVRVVEKSDYYDILGKILSWWEDSGFTYALIFERVSCNAKDALKIADEWLKGRIDE